MRCGRIGLCTLFLLLWPCLEILGNALGHLGYSWGFSLRFASASGFRSVVIGEAYLRYYEDEVGRAFTDPIIGDPGYILLNRLMVHWDWKVYGVNFACGLFFISGLIVFCRGLYRSWLGFAVAVPYLVVVVAMGYSRQGRGSWFDFLGTCLS